MRLCRCIRDKNSWKSSENIQELLDFVLHNVVPYSGLQSVEGHRIHVHAPKWVKVSVLGEHTVSFENIKPTKKWVLYSKVMSTN